MRTITYNRAVMIALLSLLLIIVLSILVTRVATIALIHTGLSRESARFQARSAFTGAGFTTQESERVVRHPVRRRIIMMLMLLGNAGIVTAVASLMLAFVGTASALSAGLKMAALVVGVALLWALSMSKWVERRLSHLIAWALKRYTRLDVQDYAALMHLAGDYQIGELKVQAADWLAGRTLRESGLREEGVLVLGIERPDGRYVGAPLPETRIEADDVLLLYGRAEAFADLDERRRGIHGERAHERAVAEHELAAARESEPGPEDPGGEGSSSV